MHLRSLYLSCVLVVGCSGDDSGESTAASSGEATTLTSGGSSAAATEATTDAGEGSTSTAGDDTTASAGDSGTTSTAPDPLGPCMQACEHLVDCEIEDVANCALPCVGQPEAVAGCEDPYIAQQECVIQLSCEDAAAWADMVGDPYPCQSADQALQVCLAG